ncbi:MAG: glycoside hydrolase family 31 protein, partial [Anaerolineae bacterium]
GRSAYAGSQRYPVQWGGDSYGSFDQLACQMRGLLSYGMSGVPFCSHDVGGFDYSPQAFDQPNPEDYPKDPELYVRWLQFGVFSSHIRAHGKQPREPWTYGPQAEEIARRYLKLRYRLLPYIYSEAVKSAQTGLPMVRPLVLEFQSDPNTHSLDSQYMFGESFLVAPIITPVNRRQVYLPPGNWVDYWSKKPVKGGCWIKVEAPLEIIPLWVRAGAIIPMGPELSYVEEKPLDPLTLELYWPQDSMETVVQEEDRPGIPVRYRRNGNKLNVGVGPAPGLVEIVLYGVTVQGANCDGIALDVLHCPGGQLVRVNGTKPVIVEIQLTEH